jgi:peptidoglycan-associated lipoprotein
MYTKQLSILTLVVAGALGGCAQQGVAPTDVNASETITTTETTYLDGANGGGTGIGGRGGLGQGQGGNGGGTATNGYDNGTGVGYDAYEAEKRRAAAERARQAELARQRAAAERARQQGRGGISGQYGNGQYGNSGDQYGNGRGGQYGNGSNGQYGSNQYGNGGQYGNNQGGSSGADAALLSRRIIYFDYDQSSIKPEYMAILDAHAKYLRANPNAQVRLEGHADDRGSREYNLALSEHRSMAVRDYMSVKGAGGARMNTIGYGEEMPVKLGQDEQSWSQNRRVEIKYIGE